MIYKAAALIIVSTFYVSYLIKQIYLRTKGINANKLAKGSKSQSLIMKEAFLIGCTFLLPVLQYKCILLNSGYHNNILSIAGLTVSAIGLFLFVAAMYTMGLNWRAGVDTDSKTNFVNTGVYKISRNPAFTGFDLFYMGIAVMYPNIILIAATMCGIALFHLQILEEEQYLQSAFGQEYIDYKAKTRRYL